MRHDFSKYALIDASHLPDRTQDLNIGVFKVGSSAFGGSSNVTRLTIRRKELSAGGQSQQIDELFSLPAVHPKVMVLLLSV